MRSSAAFRLQASACGRLGSPMYADLLARVADDIEAGGPCARVLPGHADDAGPSALALRLMGSVHRLVLERRAGALATSTRASVAPGSAEGGWDGVPRLRRREQPDAVREWLDRPPQTNEVGRSAALMAGLLALTDEHGTCPSGWSSSGSSAGLNLLADRFRYQTDDGRAVGPEDSPVVLDRAWSGDVPLDAPWPRLVERVGSDVMPVDVTARPRVGWR